MRCQQAQDAVLLALYGEADEATLHETSVHLSTCAACRQEAARLEEAAAAVARAEGRPARRRLVLPVVVAAEPPARARAPRRVTLALAATLALVALAAVVTRNLAPSGSAVTSPAAPDAAVTAAAAPATDESFDTEVAALDEALAALESSSREF